MTWTPELDELARRSAMALQMGGADKVQRQHDGGRLTVRERITQLLDAGSFHEVGALSGIGENDAAGTVQAVTPANCVFGRGRVDGRPVVVVGGPKWRCGLDGAGQLAAAAAAGEIVRAINATPTHPQIGRAHV